MSTTMPMMSRLKVYWRNRLRVVLLGCCLGKVFGNRLGRVGGCELLSSLVFGEVADVLRAMEFMVMVHMWVISLPYILSVPDNSTELTGQDENQLVPYNSQHPTSVLHRQPRTHRDVDKR